MNLNAVFYLKLLWDDIYQLIKMKISNNLEYCSKKKDFQNFRKISGKGKVKYL